MLRLYVLMKIRISYVCGEVHIMLFSYRFAVWHKVCVADVMVFVVECLC